MDKVTLVIKGLRPISLNRLHYRNRKLTQEAREYRGSFLSQLQAYSDELKALSKTFQPTKHSIALSCHFKMPQSEYFTNKGYISARSQDLDNLLKLNIDCLCNAEYNDPKWLKKKQRSPREKKFYSDLKAIQNLDIDDKFISEIHTGKSPTDGPHEILISISIVDLGQPWLFYS
jgi:Holliday junction resolvase RusA-like endonuclease